MKRPRNLREALAPVTSHLVLRGFPFSQARPRPVRTRPDPPPGPYLPCTVTTAPCARETRGRPLHLTSGHPKPPDPVRFLPGAPLLPSLRAQGPLSGLLVWISKLEEPVRLSSAPGSRRSRQGPADSCWVSPGRGSRSLRRPRISSPVPFHF